MENKIRYLTHLRRHCRKMDRLGWALVLTLALWMAGPQTMQMPAVISWGRWILGVIFLGAVWKPFGSILITAWKNAWCHIVAGSAGLAFVSVWLDDFAPLIQIFIGSLFCLAMWFLLLRLSKPSHPPVYPQPLPDEFRRYPLITGLMRAVMAAEPEGKDRIRRIALTGPWGCGKTFILGATEGTQLLAFVRQAADKNQHVADVLKSTWIHRAYTKPQQPPGESEWDRTLWQAYQNSLAAGLIDGRTASRIKRTFSEAVKIGEAAF